jgi:hypothetical protein
MENELPVVAVICLALVILLAALLGTLGPQRALAVRSERDTLATYIHVVAKSAEVVQYPGLRCGHPRMHRAPRGPGARSSRARQGLVGPRAVHVVGDPTATRDTSDSTSSTHPPHDHSPTSPSTHPTFRRCVAPDRCSTLIDAFRSNETLASMRARARKEMRRPGVWSHCSVDDLIGSRSDWPS